MTMLPHGWSWSRLGSIASPSGARAIPVTSDERPFIGLEHVESGTSKLIGQSRASEMRSSCSTFSAGDLLYGRLRPYLNKVCAPAFDGLASGEFIVLKPADHVEVRFLLYRMVSADFVTFATHQSEGDRPRAKWKQLSEFPIALPPIAEQRRIVEVIEEQFSSLDAAEASLKRAICRVRLAREFAFTSVIGFDGAAYSPLGAIAEIVGGITKDSKRETDPGFIEVPYLRVANVQRGYLDLSDITTIRVDRTKADKLRLMPGDVLFNEGGDRDKLGRGWVWEGQIEGCIHQNHVFRARVNSNAYEPKFVSLYGNSVGRQWFERMGKQTTNLASLNLATLKSFPIPRVPMEDQRRVVSETERQLSIYERMAVELETALGRSLRLRRAVLEKAFSRRIVARGTRRSGGLEAAAGEDRRRASQCPGPDGIPIAMESEIRV